MHLLSGVRHSGPVGVVLLALTLLCPSLAVSADSRPVSLPFRDLNGKKVRVSDFRGKIVVLNFWATWCVPCREEMPLLVEAESKYGPRGVVFIAASLDDRETRPKIPEFLDKFGIRFPIWTGASTLDLDDLKLGQMLPATAFLDRDGRVKARVLGQLTRDELYERLEWFTGDRNGPTPSPRVDHLADKK